MKITVTATNPEAPKWVESRTFDNSIDANEERDHLEKCGFVVTVKWDCK